MQLFFEFQCIFLSVKTQYSYYRHLQKLQNRFSMALTVKIFSKDFWENRSKTGRLVPYKKLHSS